MSEREEFEDLFAEICRHPLPFGIKPIAEKFWQARGDLEAKKLESSDARYQARIKDLEEALRLLLKNAQSYGEAWARFHVADYNSIAVDSMHTRAQLLGIMQDRLTAVPKALSTTPDTALQRKLLDARIDENSYYGGEDTERAYELRAQLTALNKGESIESEKEDVREPCPVCFIRECNGECSGE